MKIKVCGLKYSENIKAISMLDVDFMGFIFYRNSPRWINKLNPEILCQIIEKPRVGVFVNEKLEKIIEIQKKYNLDYLQLHGNESVSDCRKLSEYAGIIKAFQVDNHFDFDRIGSFETAVNFFLFDTKSKKYGGSGKKFNWDIFGQYKSKIPFFLSGGISVRDVPAIKKIKNKSFFAVDINSGFEKKPGLKNRLLIEEFITKMRK